MIAELLSAMDEGESMEKLTLAEIRQKDINKARK